jgi:hypothetical protein
VRFSTKLSEAMDKKLNFGGETARLIDDPKGYVFSMITQTYIWLDNLLYLEELAKRGQSGYTELYYETLARKVGPAAQGPPGGSDHRCRQLLVHGLDGGGPAGAQIGLIARRFARRASSAYDPLRTGLALRYFCR